MSSSEAPSAPTEPEARKGPSQRQLLLIGLIALALIIVGVLAYPRSNSSSTPGSVAVGDHVPHFSLPSLSGSGQVGVPTSTRASTPTVLIFFAHWCGPCKTEMPALSAAINAGGAEPATVIGVNALDLTSPAKAFVAAHDITFPVGVDETGQVTNGAFGFPALPETVFVSPKGIITEIHFGATTPAQLRAGVEAAR
jgi:peroxiredoxin